MLCVLGPTPKGMGVWGLGRAAGVAVLLQIACGLYPELGPHPSPAALLLIIHSEHGLMHALVRMCLIKTTLSEMKWRLRI